MKKNNVAWLFPVLLLAGCAEFDVPVDTSRGVFAESAAPAAAPVAKSKRLNAVQPNVSGFTESDSYFQQDSSRMMAYTAGFTLTVKQQNKALDDLKELAESFGGYLISRSRGILEVKIPVGRADDFMKKSGDHGKMSDLRISAEDLTDTITDLDVRLENLRKLRTRLTELLGKAKNVDEMIKVERELNRITTEIERLTAQLQNNKNRVDTVTFTISVIEERGAFPGGTPLAISKFRFLQKLVSTDGGDEDEPLFDIGLPEGFAGMTEGSVDADTFAATSGDDCIFRTWERDIPDDSTLEFWEKMVCRALEYYDNATDIKTFPAVQGGRKAVKITARMMTARGLQKYMAVIAVERGTLCSDSLQIVEFFGPSEAFGKHEKAVSAAIQ
jgi:hypothetical protein